MMCKGNIICSVFTVLFCLVVVRVAISISMTRQTDEAKTEDLLKCERHMTFENRSQLRFIGEVVAAYIILVY